MNIIVQMGKICYMLHKTGSDCIGKKSGNKENNMPGPQLFLNSFSPYTNCIKKSKLKL